MAGEQRLLFEDLPEQEPPPDLSTSYELPSAPAPSGQPDNCRCSAAVRGAYTGSVVLHHHLLLPKPLRPACRGPFRGVAR